MRMALCAALALLSTLTISPAAQADVKTFTYALPTAFNDGSPLTPAQLPPDWLKIKVGSVVLASDRESDGWWQAVVEEEKKADSLLVLRWRQAPDMDVFLRRIDQVALLPTAYRGS